MRALSIAWKDVRHAYRSVAGLAMMLVAPLLLAGAMGAAFGSGDNYSIAPVQDRRGRPGRAAPGQAGVPPAQVSAGTVSPTRSAVRDSPIC